MNYQIENINNEGLNQTILKIAYDEVLDFLWDALETEHTGCAAKYFEMVEQIERKYNRI